MVKTIFFDFDGTLISKRVSILANKKRTQFFSKNFDKKNLEKIQRKSDNHYSIVQNIIRKSLNLDFDMEELVSIQGTFFSYFYIKTIERNLEKYLVVDFKKLKKLKKKYNLKFVIATSLIKPTIYGALNVLKQKDLFDDVFYCDIFLKKTKKDIVNIAFEKYKKYNPILMCGDKIDDIKAGNNIRVKTIQTFFDKKDDKIKEADFIVKTSNELIEKIESTVKK